MATPSTSLEDEGFLSDPPSSTEKRGDSDSRVTRKRNRESLDDNFDDTVWDLTDDGRPKTRRVNPQRLAIRLGPELVAEMEAHIIPGAKMPTFAVRKDFQERYSVDRRHIYDYFHSRGLRVAKEDKHTNLIRGRALKAQAQAQAIPKPTTVTIKEESPPCEALQTRTFLAPAAPLPKPRGRVPKKPTKSQEKRVHAIGRPPKVSYAPKKSTPDFYIPPVPSGEEPSSEAEAILGASSSGTDTDWETSLAYPEFSLSGGTSGDGAHVLKSGDGFAFMNMPDDFVAGYFDSPEQPQLPFFDDESMIQIDSEPYMAEKDTLNEAERTELYNLIDTNIPLALEQSVGSYRSFMDERSQSYFDHLLPLLRRPRAPKLATTVHKNMANDSAPSVEVPDIRKWLSDDLDLYQNCAMDASSYDFHPSRDDSDRKNVNDVITNNGCYTAEGKYHPGILQSQPENIPRQEGK